MGNEMSNELIIKKENLIQEVNQVKESSSKVFFVVDKNVYSIYGNIIEDMDESQFIVLESSEAKKDINTVMEIYDRLIESKYTRTDYILALGGGVIGDIVAFVASTYMRGMKFINVPTTLLSIVDSSIGGKTGFNYKGLKNMIGSFKQADYLFLDYSFLDSLDEIEFKTGMAEVIKVAMTFDAAFFSYLETLDIEKLRDEMPFIIERARKIKKDVTDKDFEDKNIRNALNFGHGIGHAIESIYLEEGKKITHGYAISMGMAEIMELTCKKGLCEYKTRTRFLTLLKKYGLPNKLEISKKRIYDYILHDKKKKNGLNNIVISEEVGQNRILGLTDLILKDFLEID